MREGQRIEFVDIDRRAEHLRLFDEPQQTNLTRIRRDCMPGTDRIVVHVAAPDMLVLDRLDEIASFHPGSR